MEIVVLGHRDVAELLSPSVCIDLMAEVLLALEREEAFNPLRSVVRPPGRDHFLGLMPAYRGGDQPAYALKEVCIFPDNPTRGLDAHQGAVLLHSAATGELIGVFDGSAITAIRTAAVSGLATRLLAPADRDAGRTLAILGTGVQGRSHLAAMAAVGGFARARVASRRPERAESFARELEPSVPFALEPAADVERAVRDADVVVTATNAREPILRRSWLAEGAHLNAVGSSIPTTRELDTETVAAAKLFVDRRESTLNESGDFLFAAREAGLGPEHIQAELGEVLAGRHPGRERARDLTVFKSLGIAVEDLAAAQYLHRRALEEGVGTRVDF